MDLEKISRWIGKYEYSKRDLLDRDLAVQYDPDLHAAVIPDFYDYTGNGTCGSCAELQVKAYLEAKDVFPDYYVIRANGSEPRYFNGFSTHFFLLFSEKDLMKGAQKAEGFRNCFELIAYDALTSKTPAVLVDPSLKIVCPFYKSGYGISGMVNQGAEYEYPIDDFLSDLYPVGRQKTGILSTPLFISGSGKVVSLYTNFSKEDFLGIIIQEPEGEKYYPLHSTELNELSNEDSKLAKFVTYFRKVPLVRKEISLGSLKTAKIC